MSQVTHGIRSLLSHPILYDLTQAAFGAARSRKRLVRDYIRPKPDAYVIDIGCGTGEILPYLPSGVRYVGFDLSEHYIESARKRYGDRGRFECMDVANFRASENEGADLIIAIGLLHHLDDIQVANLIETAWSKLKVGGRFITLDGTLVPEQSSLARFLILKDRGMNIRSPEAYESLAGRRFTEIRRTVRHDMLRIPYTHCILECTRV